MNGNRKEVKDHEKEYWKKSCTLSYSACRSRNDGKWKTELCSGWTCGDHRSRSDHGQSCKPHYTNQGIKETRALTVNIVDESMMKKADRTGCVSGNKVDKSDMFAFHTEGTGAPVIDEAPVVMDCIVDDIYETEGFESFICKIDGVYAEENVLNDAGKIDYHTLKPVLFEMPTYEYLRTGDVIGKCMNMSEEMK